LFGLVWPVAARKETWETWEQGPSKRAATLDNIPTCSTQLPFSILLMFCLQVPFFVSFRRLCRTPIESQIKMSILISAMTLSQALRRSRPTFPSLSALGGSHRRTLHPLCMLSTFVHSPSLPHPINVSPPHHNPTMPASSPICLAGPPSSYPSLATPKFPNSFDCIAKWRFFASPSLPVLGPSSQPVVTARHPGAQLAAGRRFPGKIGDQQPNLERITSEHTHTPTHTHLFLTPCFEIRS